MAKITITSFSIHNLASSMAALVEVRSEKLRNLLQEAVHIAGTHKFEYRGYQLEIMEGRDAVLVISPRFNCSQLCDKLGAGNHCGSRCPVLRAVQGFLTRCRQLVESAAEDSSESCANPEEPSGADAELPSPDMEEAESRSKESMSDKQEGASSETASRSLPKESQDSEEAESEPCSDSVDHHFGDQAGEASGVKRAASQAPQSGEDNFCPTPSGESRPEPEGDQMLGGSPASASSQEGQSSKGEGCEAGASEGESSLEHRPVGAEESGQEESSQREAGLDSSPARDSSGSVPERDGNEATAATGQGTGSLWEMEFNLEEDQHSYGGGGLAKALSAKDSNAATEKQVVFLLRHFFAEIEDIFRKKEGQDRWDARKVIYSCMVAPQDLPISKFSRPSFRKISLWVDVSGSVSHLTGFIISLITAACKDKDVQVVIGSEAHPQKVLPKNFYKLNEGWWVVDAVWEREYTKQFEEQVEIFLRENKLEQGSLIVIWSDYMDIHADNLFYLSTLLKPYRVVWLCSHAGKDRDYSGNESFKLEAFAWKQGHLFLWGIDSPEGIRKAIKYINIKNMKRR